MSEREGGERGGESRAEVRVIRLRVSQSQDPGVVVGAVRFFFKDRDRGGVVWGGLANDSCLHWILSLSNC